MLFLSVTNSLRLSILLLALSYNIHSAPTHHLTIGVQGNTPTLMVTSAEIGITADTMGFMKKPVKTDVGEKTVKDLNLEKKPLKSKLNKSQTLLNKKDKLLKMAAGEEGFLGFKKSFMETEQPNPINNSSLLKKEQEFTTEKQNIFAVNTTNIPKIPTTTNVKENVETYKTNLQLTRLAPDQLNEMAITTTTLPSTSKKLEEDFATTLRTKAETFPQLKRKHNANLKIPLAYFSTLSPKDFDVIAETTTAMNSDEDDTILNTSTVRQTEAPAITNESQTQILQDTTVIKTENVNDNDRYTHDPMASTENENLLLTTIETKAFTTPSSAAEQGISTPTLITLNEDNEHGTTTTEMLSLPLTMATMTTTENTVVVVDDEDSKNNRDNKNQKQQQLPTEEDLEMLTDKPAIFAVIADREERDSEEKDKAAENPLVSQGDNNSVVTVKPQQEDKMATTLGQQQEQEDNQSTEETNQYFTQATTTHKTIEQSLENKQVSTEILKIETITETEVVQTTITTPFKQQQQEEQKPEELITIRAKDKILETTRLPAFNKTNESQSSSTTTTTTTTEEPVLKLIDLEKHVLKTIDELKQPSSLLMSGQHDNGHDGLKNIKKKQLIDKHYVEALLHSKQDVHPKESTENVKYLQKPTEAKTTSSTTTTTTSKPVLMPIKHGYLGPILMEEKTFHVIHHADNVKADRSHQHWADVEAQLRRGHFVELKAKTETKEPESSKERIASQHYKESWEMLGDQPIEDRQYMSPKKFQPFNEKGEKTLKALVPSEKKESLEMLKFKEYPKLSSNKKPESKAHSQKFIKEILNPVSETDAKAFENSRKFFETDTKAFQNSQKFPEFAKTSTLQPPLESYQELKPVSKDYPKLSFNKKPVLKAVKQELIMEISNPGINTDINLQTENSKREETLSTNEKSLRDFTKTLNLKTALESDQQSKSPEFAEISSTTTEDSTKQQKILEISNSDETTTIASESPNTEITPTTTEVSTKQQKFLEISNPGETTVKASESSNAEISSTSNEDLTKRQKIFEITNLNKTTAQASKSSNAEVTLTSAENSTKQQIFLEISSSDESSNAKVTSTTTEVSTKQQELMEISNSEETTVKASESSQKEEKLAKPLSSESPQQTEGPPKSVTEFKKILTSTEKSSMISNPESPPQTEKQTKSSAVLSTTVFQVIDSVATKTPMVQANTLFTSEDKEEPSSNINNKEQTESKISDIQIEVYDSTIDSIVASTNFKDSENRQHSISFPNDESFLGKTTKPPVASIQQERFTQYVIDRSETSTQEPINYSTIQVASGKPEPAAIEIHINVSESFGNESEDLEFSYPQSEYNNNNNERLGEESYDMNDNIKLKIPTASQNLNSKDPRNDEILVVEIIDTDNNSDSSFKGKLKKDDELFITDVKELYTTPPPPPPPPPYQTNFDRDSDTIFYISNTEVKVGESLPSSSNDNEERKHKLESQFFPANYVASTHPNVNIPEESGPASHHLYEEDIILSSSRNQADSLKIYRNRNDPSPPLDVTYVGESIIEVEQSPDSGLTTTFSPEQQHNVATPQADVIIQPAILPEISIGVPVIGELPPQIELKEIDFMPNEAQLHRSGIYDDNDMEENTINGGSNSNHDIDINSGTGSNSNQQRVDESSIQYGGDLIDESADGGFDGVEGSYPFGNPATNGKSSSSSYTSNFMAKLRKQQQQQREQHQPNHVADYAHLYVNYGVNNMRKDELSADVKDSGELLLVGSGGNDGGTINVASINSNEQNTTSFKEFLNKISMSNSSIPYSSVNSTQNERMSNATAFSVMEDANDLEDKSTEDIINLISLAIGLFIVILPVVVTCSMFWALRYLYKKYHSGLTDTVGYTDQTETKSPLNDDDGAEKGESVHEPSSSPTNSNNDAIEKCPETSNKPSTTNESNVKFSCEKPSSHLGNSSSKTNTTNTTNATCGKTASKTNETLKLSLDLISPITKEQAQLLPSTSAKASSPTLSELIQTVNEGDDAGVIEMAGPNGSITIMTLENNLLIVETEERNDISRVARETKMDYNKDGVFVVEVSRGIDSKTIPESPVTDGSEKMLSMFETKQNNGGIGYKVTNEKNCINNEKVQIHSPPPENTNEEGPRSLHQIEEVEEPSSSPLLNEIKGGEGDELVGLAYKANTGLSQSDLSTTSSNDSNKGYCYGNQELYVLEQSGYSTVSPSTNVALKCDAKDVKDRNDHNPGNDHYLKHSPDRREESKEKEDMVEASKQAEEGRTRTSSGESPAQRQNDKVEEFKEEEKYTVISNRHARDVENITRALTEEKLDEKEFLIEEELPKIKELQSRNIPIPVEIEVHITPADNESSTAENSLSPVRSTVTADSPILKATEGVTEPLVLETIDDVIVVETIAPIEISFLANDEQSQLPDVEQFNSEGNDHEEAILAVPDKFSDNDVTTKNEENQVEALVRESITLEDNVSKGDKKCDEGLCKEEDKEVEIRRKHGGKFEEWKFEENKDEHKADNKEEHQEVNEEDHKDEHEEESEEEHKEEQEGEHKEEHEGEHKEENEKKHKEEKLNTVEKESAKFESVIDKEGNNLHTNVIDEKESDLENGVVSNEDSPRHINGVTDLENTERIEENNKLNLVEEDLSKTETHNGSTTLDNESLTNGSCNENDLVKSQNGHMGEESIRNSFADTENGYDSIMSLPEPPPTTDEQQNSDLSEQQLDSLPPPPPPEIFSLKDLPPPLTNGNVDSPQSEESNNNFYHTLPPPPPNTLEVTTTAESITTETTTTNGKVHASPLTPPASPPAHFTNNLHAGLCSQSIAVDVNGS